MLCKKFKKSNFVQQIIIFIYLKVLKIVKQFEFNKIKQYICKYIVVFNMLLQKKIQLQMQNK